MNMIERLHLHRLSLPLTTPYKLAFGPVVAFDTIIARVWDADGREGFGEATILTGYTPETIDSAWRIAGELAAAMLGAEFEPAKATALAAHTAAPFTATALATAVEMLEGSPLLQTPGASVPLLAIINATDPAGIEQEIEARIAEGYETLKIKVGFDLETDLQRVAFIQSRLGDRARIRLDGNQGYSRDDGVHFAAALDPDGIELLEQPCHMDDWQAAEAAAKVATVPMMLDESIYGADEIKRAADLKAARYIKLKLMKAGSLADLAEQLELIGDLDMIPVLGNGVASDPGCWMEACIAHRYINNAGEMNGFLKPTGGLFVDPITVTGGTMVLPVTPPILDQAAILRHQTATAVFPESYG